MKNFTKAFAIGLLLLITANVSRGQTTFNFNDGYLIVFKVTSGSALASTGTAIVMEEYVNTGSSQTSPNYYVALPSSPTTLGANDIVVAGTSTAVGEISRSENGRYILIPGYNALIGAANTTFTTNSVVRTLNGTGTMGSGISGSNFLSGSNSLRGAVSEDLTNYWMSGSTVGITTSTNGTSVTIVSTTSTNTRACYIFNGQLYYTTGAGSQGIYSVGIGKPVVTGTPSTRLFTPTNTDTYGFSISPDSLTIYYVASTSGGIYRSTFSGGVWSGGTLITSGFTGYGIAVDWTGYTFNLSGPNGAKNIRLQSNNFNKRA